MGWYVELRKIKFLPITNFEETLERTPRNLHLDSLLFTYRKRVVKFAVVNGSPEFGMESFFCGSDV